MIRKALLASGVVLLLGAASCGSKDATTSAPTTTAGAPSTTAKEKESTTTAKDKESTTTAKDDETTTTKKKSAPKTSITKPTKIEKIDPAKLPAVAKNKPKNLDLSESETDCVQTVVADYAADPSNATDDATMSGVLGGAIAACVDPNTIANGIVAGIKETAPDLTATQATCLKKEIAGAETGDLALFLGSFLYEGAGADELQKPFIEALGKVCNLG